jgi:circadian clock protein KaiC
MSEVSEPKKSVSTGIRGLDHILNGGFTVNRMCLIEGTPGAGKTTLALQFVLAGRDQGESVMYITLSETAEELKAGAQSHGMNLDNVEIVEIIPQEEELDPDNQFSMFPSWEAQLSQTTQTILSRVDQSRPLRVVIDSLSELRLQSQNALRFRRQILSLKQFFLGRNCTVLMLDDKSSDMTDIQMQSIAHGVLQLEQLSPEYGSDRRRLHVTKMRGKNYSGGFHDFIIEEGGLVVFPRLIAAEHTEDVEIPTYILSSGIKQLDDLLGGGIEYGTSVLLTGPAGSGKSTLSYQYVKAALDRGDSAAIFTFDERRVSILRRALSMGTDIEEVIDSNRLTIQQVDPGELSPGQFCDFVRHAVDVEKVSVVVIDSLNGFLASMPEERYLVIQMHELLTYLGHKGIVSFLIVAQHGLLGSAMVTPIDTTYLADAVVLLRYFETAGQVKRAISVMKKRSGNHEKTIREFSLDNDGIHIGEPLASFHGVLTGTPEYTGDIKPLIGGINE